MKAIILAAGRGTRQKQITEEINKCMLKVDGKHLLAYSLASAKQINVEEIVIVVGYHAEYIINTFGIWYEDIPIKYVIQKDQKGLVDAISQTRKTIDGADFILFLGDEIHVNPQLTTMTDQFESEDLFVMCGVTETDDLTQISKTYSVIYNEFDYSIYRLIEKPTRPPNNIMGTGNCIFRNEIFEYIDKTPVSHVRKEKELPDLIQCAIDEGQAVKMFILASQYANVNTPDDIDLAKDFFVQALV